MKTLCIITGQLRSHLKIIDDFYKKIILSNRMDVFYFLSKEDEIYKNELITKINFLLKNTSSKLMGVHFQNGDDDINECKTMVFRRIRKYVEKKYSTPYLNTFLGKIYNGKATFTKNDYELAEKIANHYYPYQGLHQSFKLKRSFFYLNDILNNYDFLFRIRPDIDLTEKPLLLNTELVNEIQNQNKKWVLIKWDFMIFGSTKTIVDIFTNLFEYYNKNCFPDNFNKSKIDLFADKTELKNYAKMFGNQFRIYSEHLLLNYFIENEIMVYDHPYPLSIKNSRELNDKQLKMEFTSNNNQKLQIAKNTILKHHNYFISIRFLKNDYYEWTLNDWITFCKNKNIILKKSYFYNENKKEIIIKQNDKLNQFIGKTIINEI